MKKSRAEIIRMLKNTALIVIGSTLIALACGMFIIPFELVVGGVAGIGIVMHRLLSDVAFLSGVSAETYALIVNWILYFIGLAVLGRSFAAKTLVSAIVYSSVISLIGILTRNGAFGGFFDLTSEMYAGYGQIVLMIATVFGGAAVGTGVALTFLGGGSSGGTDIIALSACKLFKRLKSSTAIFVVDAAIIIAGVFSVNNLVLSLLGIGSAFICALAVDRIFLGSAGALSAVIVSNEYEKINHAIIHRLGRTTTMSDAIGGYSGAPKKQIFVTFSMRQYAEFTAIMASVDKRAFITVSRAHEINGEGWTYESPDKGADKGARDDA